MLASNEEDPEPCCMGHMQDSVGVQVSANRSGKSLFPELDVRYLPVTRAPPPRPQEHRGSSSTLAVVPVTKAKLSGLAQFEFKFGLGGTLCAL